MLPGVESVAKSFSEKEIEEKVKKIDEPCRPLAEISDLVQVPCEESQSDENELERPDGPIESLSDVQEPSRKKSVACR